MQELLETKKTSKMKNSNFNIYLTGVGGQGLGLLSEAIIRAADSAGLKAAGTDTHGLAQRGGTVDSTIRIGENIYSPLIKKGCADLVIGMEINESLRGINEYLKNRGTLVYYNVSWQPLSVRLRKAKEIKPEQLSETCNNKNARFFVADYPDLKDSRMQNVVLLATLAKNQLIPEISKEDYLKALERIMYGKALEMNTIVFEKIFHS
jgi:indolepyruvate ferredoxin oxidoreductase, beta subunit